MPRQLTRREWNAIAVTGITGLFIPTVLTSCGAARFIPSALKETGAAIEAEKLGIVLGLQTYSFRDRSLEDAIAAMTQLGVKSCELWEGHVEPRALKWKAGQTSEEAKSKNEQLKKWRESLSMDDIKVIKSKFDRAGITILAYNCGIKDNISDSALDLVFRIAETLGVGAITTSATVSVMKRADVYARRYKMIIAMHNHSHTEKPNEFSSPDSFARGMEGLSKYIWINLDIGHFAAANFNAADYLLQHHKRIFCIHIKDRKKNQGENVALGQGDTPIVQVLQLIRDKQWPIPANIEYEYEGADAVEEVKKCLDYCKMAVLS